jgi:cell division protein FtsI (penicillin-binding protein 3)
VKDVKKDILWRVYLVYVMMLLFAMAIMVRVVYIQFYQGKMWREKAREHLLTYEQVDARRGNIYARDGSLLATSIPIFDLRMDADKPEISDDFFNKNADSLAACLTCIFKDLPAKAYKKAMKDARQAGNRYYLLKGKITYDELARLKSSPAYKLWKNLAVLSVEEKSRREMPFKSLARRTIGYESENARVFVGLEGTYSSYLVGKSGQRLMKKIAGGMWIPVTDENEVEPENGADIYSTIDINIQDVAENALLAQLIAQDADHGCAVVMEVETGQVLAIANLGKDKNSRYDEILNYAVGESLEPGSTFKLISLMAALEEKKVNANDIINVGSGTFIYHGRTIRDVHKFRDGLARVSDVFKYSSNVGMSKIIINGFAKDPKAFTDRLLQFCINKPLGLEISGEQSPVLHTPDHPLWSLQSLPSMAMGYEVKLTPIQLLTFYNAVANHGKMVRPMFVREIRRSGQMVRTFDPVVINPSICSATTLNTMYDLLEQVVEEGTGVRLKNPLYKIAGKTGTAKLASANEGYNESAYSPSFVGFFPADHPKYSCIVVINRPSKGKYLAAEVAVPVFKVIADKLVATHTTLPPRQINDSTRQLIPAIAGGYRDEIRTICSDANVPVAFPLLTEPWIRGTMEDKRLFFKDMVTEVPDSGTIIMPDMTGFGARDALCILESMGLSPSIDGKGHVTGQSPLPGDTCFKGEKIVLTLNPL